MTASTTTSARDPVEDSLVTSLSLLSRLHDLGDQTAWRRFFDRYWRLIYNFSLRSGLGDADAQDIVQEVMVNLTESLPNFEPDAKRGRFKTWLLTIVKRRIIDHHRRRMRKPTVRGELAENLLVEEAELEKLWDSEWKGHVLDVALQRVRARVAARQFLIYDLLVKQGATVREVCRALDTNPAAVYLAKHRVAKLLAREMEQLENPKFGGSSE
jgi:RNA polymerase sigma-70 factor (ECF subfamily)